MGSDASVSGYSEKFIQYIIDNDAVKLSNLCPDVFLNCRGNLMDKIDNNFVWEMYNIPLDMLRKALTKPEYSHVALLLNAPM